MFSCVEDEDVAWVAEISWTKAAASSTVNRVEDVTVDGEELSEEGEGKVGDGEGIFKGSEAEDEQAGSSSPNAPHTNKVEMIFFTRSLFLLFYIIGTTIIGAHARFSDMLTGRLLLP